MGDMEKPRLTDLTPLQVTEMVAFLGAPAYRGRQLLEWVYQRLASSYEEMTDLPLPLRQQLAEKLSLHAVEPVRELVSRDGTVKTLFRLHDGATIEAALMLYAAGAGRPRTTVCLSTQVGCPIGCCFCATGQQGFERNLTPGEMVDQVLHYARRVRDRGGEGRLGHITNLVFMGMGEPLANYDSVMQAVGVLTSPGTFGLGARSITISTAGMVPQIRKLAQEKPQVGLAVSLHAPDDDLRDRLVPLNKRYPLQDLLAACRGFSRETGRRVSFEYVLLAGINDSLAQAWALGALLMDMNCHVNLIPANAAVGGYGPPSLNATLAFERQLRAAGVNCTLRQSRGQDIAAGCGMLRSRFLS